MATKIVQWFGPNDDNPGCDCGMADAVVRTDSGELICAERAQELGIATNLAHTDLGESA